MDKKIFKVILNNLECAFCKELHCPMRYYPEHTRIIGTQRYGCKKDFEKSFRAFDFRIFKKKWNSKRD